MRKNSRDYVKEVTGEPFELDLDNPPEGGPAYVTFKNPTKIGTEAAFNIARSQDPQEIAEALLEPAEYGLWWEEWRRRPFDETMALLQEAQGHYGSDPGKSRS